ncbi:MAG: helix-turn-helix domain-containing protein [Lachnospiraceae bacterium]|nr:helix-turn-helix domain-containing protein [Lachnospiraceae bacterium]
MDACTTIRCSMSAVRINTIPDLSRRTGIKRATMYNRMKNIGSMTLRELQEIARVTHMSTEQIAEVVLNA